MKNQKQHTLKTKSTPKQNRPPSPVGDHTNKSKARQKSKKSRFVKFSHGGARQGAGAPSIEGEPRIKMLSVRATLATLDKLKQDSESLKLSQAEYLKRLIDKGL